MGARRDAHADIRQHVLSIGLVAEIHFVEHDVALQLRQRCAVRIECRFALFVHDVAKARHRDANLLEILPHIDETQDWRDDLPREHLECDELADRKTVLHDLIRANPKNREVECHLEERTERARKIRDVQHAKRALEVAREHVFIALDERLLDAHRLDRAHARDGLDGERLLL